MRQHLKFRFLMVLTVFGMIFLLVACGSDDDGDDADADAGDDAADDAGDDDAGDDDAGDDDAGDDAAGDFDAESYFEGKTIRFITSSGPGGGTDVKVRTLASQLPRFIPGNPATQVSNVTPHVAGMNFLWNSEPDGLTVMLTAAPPLEFQLFGDAEWESPEFQYIGAYDSVCDSMLMVRGDLGYESIEDAMGGDETLITMTQAPSPADVEPLALGTMLVAEYLDLPLEIRRVSDSGTSAQALALERGEINSARYGATWCRIPTDNPDWFPDRFVLPLLDMGINGPGEWPEEGVADTGLERPPHVSDLVTPEQYEEFQGLVSAPRAGGNTFFLPPGTPQEIVDAWREIYDVSVEDEDFVDTIFTAFGGDPVRFIPGPEIQERITENYDVLLEYGESFSGRADELYEKYVN